MRSLALIVACSGCIISEPEGKSQDWPPGFGGKVEAVVAGDLDANGSTDIVVFTSGDESQNGMFVIKNADLQIGQSSPVKSFTRFVPTTWSAPIATDYIAGAAPRIYVAHSEATIEIAYLSNTLETLSTGATSIAPGTTLWTMPVSFPGGMVHPSASNGSNIDHLDTTFKDPKPIPPPGGGWEGAALATTYTAGMDTMVVVATRTQILRAVIPTSPGNPFNFTPVRDGAPWEGQVLADLDGNGHSEIVGFDPMAHDVCVVDPEAAVIPVATPSCIHLPTTFPGTNVTILTGRNLTMNQTPDIFVAQASAQQTDYTMIEDVTYTPTTASLTSGNTMQTPTMGPSNGITVLANSGAGTPFVALTFGTDASVVCVVGPC